MHVALAKSRRASEADVSSIFPCVVVHWQSGLKAACLIVILDRQLYVQNVCTLQVFCFVKYITQNMN